MSQFPCVQRAKKSQEKFRKKNLFKNNPVVWCKQDSFCHIVKRPSPFFHDFSKMHPDPSHNMKKVGKKICTNHYKLWHFQPFFFTKCIEPKIRLDESFSGQGGQLNCGISILAAYELFIPFSIFVFLWFWLLKLRKCLFTFFKILDCLALQTETIIKKITQPELPNTKNELTKICNKPGIHLWKSK